MKSFSGTIYKLGINPVVDPPDDVLWSLFDQAGRNKGPIRVRGLLNGVEYIQTLVKYSGAWRLYINAEMLRASGAEVGDTVRIEIEYDKRPRDVPMPALLAGAFKHNAEANKAYLALSPSRQKEILRYLGSLRSQDSIARNVEKILGQLLG